MNLNRTLKFIWKNELTKIGGEKSENVITLRIWGELACQTVKHIIMLSIGRDKEL